MSVKTKCVILKDPTLAHDSIQSYCHTYTATMYIGISMSVGLYSISYYFLEPCLLLPYLSCQRRDTKPDE